MQCLYPKLAYAHVGTCRLSINHQTREFFDLTIQHSGEIFLTPEYNDVHDSPRGLERELC